MLKIKFLTFPQGHLVSDKEFDRLKKGFSKVGMELFRNDEPCNPDIVMVKGFSHTWKQVKDYNRPIVMYSIGTEYKKGIDLEKANESLRELYRNASIVVHISNYCKRITEKVFGKRDDSVVIIPAEEPHLPEKYPSNEIIKCVSTAIWRPIKRVDEIKRVFAELKKELPNVSIDIFGTPEGPMLDDLSIYHNYHIYIQLSRKEGMPNTVLEALSYGLPCLVTNCGGAKEAIRDAGVVIPNDLEDDIFDLDNIEPINYELFRKGFYNLLENLEDYRLKVRKRVEQELNDEIMAKQFKEVFEKLL